MKKKVLMITNNYPVPAYRRLWKKALSLKEDGFQVTIICPAGIQGPGARKYKGIKIHYLKKSFSRNAGLGSFLMGELSDLVKVSLVIFSLYIRRSFSVLHLVNPTDTLVFSALPYRILGYRFVYEVNECFRAKFKRERIKNKGFSKLALKILGISEKIGLKMANLIIVPNNKQKLRITGAVKKQKNKIVTIEPLPDLKDFYRPLLNKDYRKGFDHLALYSGSLRIERGIVKLLRAVDFIVNKLGRDDILFVLAGAGKDEEKLKERAYKLGISKNVHFSGWLGQKKLLAYLTQADMGLVPELSRDRMGLLGDSVFEFMAVGKPLISFNSKVGKSRIGKAGVFVDHHNEYLFAREIIRVIDNKERSEAMGEVGKMKVERDLNWLKSEIKLLATYNKLVTRASLFQKHKKLIGSPV